MLAHQLRVKGKVKSKRVGRGGKTGTYCGRGGKGQTARKGFSQRATFEGGRTSIVSFSKKNRGFNVLDKKIQLVTLARLNEKFSDGDLVNPESLKEKKLISSLKFPIKILSDGDLTRKLSLENLAVSKPAMVKIEKAGGKITKKLSQEKIQKKIREKNRDLRDRS